MNDANTKGETEKTNGPSQIDKLALHPKADVKNFVALKGKKQIPYLACGAISRNKNKGDLCHSVAGHGTDHVGHGRCKYHGGCSTGPTTPETKAISAQNSTKHGFYAAALGKEEREVYSDLVEKNIVGLDHEIFMLKAKILVYLQKWRAKWEAIAEQEGETVADKETRVLTKESEGGNSYTYSYYHTGTIEDKPLMRALETLGRLVDKHAKLNTGGDGDSLVNQLNAELRAASYGKVSLSWGDSKPQARSEGGGNNERS